MKFPLYIAKRYLKSKSGNNIINIVTILACLGVVAGTTALFIVLSVFSGIENYSLGILKASTPDLRISPKKGKTFIIDEHFSEVMESLSHTTFYTKILEERAFFKNKDKEEIAYIKGVDSLFNKVTPLDSLIIVGDWFDNNSKNACITEYQLTRKLDLNVYSDLLQVYVPKPGKGYITTSTKTINTIKPQVVGVISSQNQDENKYVYVPLTLCQQLLSKTPNEISYIDLATENDEQLNKTLKYLNQKLPLFKIEKREEINGSFYKILNSEKLIAYLVSLLVVVLVLSNTSGTIIMVIVDKKKDINTLSNLGTPLKNIRLIFSIYGFLLNLAGMIIGIGIGVLMVRMQLYYKLIMITPSVAYPIAFEWGNIWIVSTTIVVFGALASVLASGRISKKLTTNNRQQ